MFPRPRVPPPWGLYARRMDRPIVVECRRRTGGTLRSFAGKEAGQSLVEFAFTLPVLLLLIMGSVEVGVMYYTRLTVRHATVEAARFAVTGNRLTDPVTGDPLSRPESIRQAVQLRADRFNVQLDSIAMDPADGGLPNEVVRISVHYTYEFSLPFVSTVFPERQRQFRVSTSMKNEPFQ
jgi:hypothetical protein